MSRYKKTKFIGVFFQESTKKLYRSRPDKVYYIVYPFNRKRKWEKVGWASEGYNSAIANKFRNERLYEVRGHTKALFVNEKFTFNDAWKMAFEKHFCYLKDNVNDLSRYNNYIKNQFGHLRLSAIGINELEMLRSKLLTLGRSPATIRHIINIITRVYNLMIKWGIYNGANPTQKIKLPKIDNHRTRYLTKEEAKMLLSELKERNIRTWQIAMLSLHTGMRAGEILALKSECIDFKKKQIRVRNTKNNKDRTVYMPNAIIEMFKEIQLIPGTFVFAKPNGKQTIAISKVFAKVVKELGFNNGYTDRRDFVVFHTLRHTFASWLVIQGKDLYLVGTLLGHSSIQMTQRYAHLAPETQQAAVNAIDSYFNN